MNRFLSKRSIFAIVILVAALSLGIYFETRPRPDPREKNPIIIVIEGNIRLFTILVPLFCRQCDIVNLKCKKAQNARHRLLC
jgi:hypothetical protein